MKGIKLVTDIFLRGPKRKCQRCSEAKSLDMFAHGSMWVGKVCRMCLGQEEVADLNNSARIPYAYYRSLGPFLSVNRDKGHRHLAAARANTEFILNKVCDFCQAEDNGIAYPYQDNYAVHPYSLFAACSQVKDAMYFCTSCSEKAYSKKPKRGRSVKAKRREKLPTPNVSAKTLPIRTDADLDDDDLAPSTIKCRTCKEYYLLSEYHNGEGKLHADCSSCRRENKRSYRFKYNQYVKTIDSPKYNELREAIFADLKENACDHCGGFHSEGNSVRYYDSKTFDQLPSELFPFVETEFTRLHRKCLKELLILKLL